MNTIKLIVAFFAAFFQIISPLGVMITGGEADFFDNWSAADKFAEDSYIELQKAPDRDFVILNLADVQLEDDELFGNEGEYTFELIEKMIEDQKPDLITLTGDNAWGLVSYVELINFIDSFEIPWAPIMGNHDGQSTFSEFWCAYLMAQADYCLFEFGPKNMGYGNYIINITENNKIIHTLYMVDTHDGATFGGIDGYDHLWENQISWYKWAVRGTENLAGEPVESTVFMHIPVYEYSTAWALYGDNATQKIKPELSEVAQGYRREDVCCSPVNNGFFKVCQDLGSTKNIICGHDHVNDFQAYYEGIRLNYALKTGYGSYWEADLNGASIITIDSLGDAEVTHKYYAPLHGIRP